MKVCLVGGSGFIGSHLISLIKSKYQLQNIDKQKSSLIETSIADVRNIDVLRNTLEPNDVVVLLAAEHRDDVSPVDLYYDVNVQGTKNILQVMEEKNINKIIFTSSVAVYGLNKVNPDENHPIEPFNHYGKSKWQAEVVLKEWYNKDSENRTLIIIRPTVVFGEKNRGNVYNLLSQIKSGKFLMIGNGENKKSMTYVGNIVQFMKYVIDKNVSGYHIFNYADKPDLTTNELVETVYKKTGKKGKPVRIPYYVGYLGGVAFDLLAKITGKKLPISSIRVRKFCATTQFSAEKVKSIGFETPYTLEEGISRTIGSI